MKKTFLGLGLALVTATTVCAREDIRVYTVPKEKQVAPMSQRAAAAETSQSSILVAMVPRNGQTWFFKLKGDRDLVESSKPAFLDFLKSIQFTDSKESPVKWNTPADWQDRGASQMVLADFSITGQNGRKGDVTITSFPGDVGGEVANVNRWRRQVGLAPLSEPPKAAPISVGSVEGKLYQIGGGDVQSADSQPGAAETAPANTDPHAGLNIPATTDADQSTTDNAFPKMDVPANWKEKAPGPMVLRNYVVQGSNGGQAVVSISSFPGDVGGELANVNRWRNQLGLPQVDDSGLASAVSPIKAQDDSGYVVDFEGANARTGQPARLIAAAVRHGDNTWFYKLLGDKATVEESKAAFLKFVKNVHY